MFCGENHKNEGVVTTTHNASCDVEHRIISTPTSDVTSIDPSDTISIAQ